MRSQEEIYALVREKINLYLHLLPLPYTSSDRKEITRDLDILDFVLNEPDVPCYNCLAPGYEGTINGVVQWVCPVCGGTQKIRPFLLLMHQEEQRLELEKTKRDWGIA